MPWPLVSGSKFKRKKRKNSSGLLCCYISTSPLSTLLPAFETLLYLLGAKTNNSYSMPSSAKMHKKCTQAGGVRLPRGAGFSLPNPSPSSLSILCKCLLLPRAIASLCQWPGGAESISLDDDKNRHAINSPGRRDSSSLCRALPPPSRDCSLEFETRAPLDDTHLLEGHKKVIVI